MGDEGDASKIGKYFLGAGAITLGFVGLEYFARKSGFIPKISKSTVKYSEPYKIKIPVVNKTLRYECEHCGYFEKPDKCSLVEGEISPTAGCARWLGLKAESEK